MNCQPSKPLTTALDYMLFLAPETFFHSVLGNGFEKRQPCEDIKTLCSMRMVCQKLKTKIDSCWNIFIRQSEYISRFFDPLKEGEIGEIAKKALTERYSTLKKWAHVDLEKWKTVSLEKWKNDQPDIKEDELLGFTEQVVIPDYLGNPTLCLGSVNCNSFGFVNLETKTSFKKDINFQARMDYNCKPCMVTNGTWTALCSNINNRANEVVIIDNNGDLLHTIKDKGNFFQLECHEEYLYISSQETFSGTPKLLQYNSNNWKGQPKEFFFPRDINFISKFCICSGQIIFFASGQKTEFWLLAGEISKLFLNNTPLLRVKTLPLKLKVFDEEFFALKYDDQQTMSLIRLYINESTIKSETLQKFPSSKNITFDFHVQLNKIFIVEDQLSYCSIFCYDLTDGKLLKIFQPRNQPCIGTNFLPQLVSSVSTPERIQLLYNSIKRTLPNQGAIATTSFTLNYGMK